MPKSPTDDEIARALVALRAWPWPYLLEATTRMSWSAVLEARTDENPTIEALATVAHGCWLAYIDRGLCDPTLLAIPAALGWVSRAALAFALQEADGRLPAPDWVHGYLRDPLPNPPMEDVALALGTIHRSRPSEVTEALSEAGWDLDVMEEVLGKPGTLHGALALLTVRAWRAHADLGHASVEVSPPVYALWCCAQAVSEFQEPFRRRWGPADSEG